MTMGVGNGDVLGKAFWLGGKRSKIVVTNIHPTQRGVDRHPGAMFLTLLREAADRLAVRLGQPRARTSRKLLELYTQGQLDLDGLVTRTYTLDQVNEGYEAMRNGENIRGVILFD